MKPHQAATLALVGWYLILPPPRDANAPLGRWIVAKAFESSKECEAEKIRQFNEANKAFNANRSGPMSLLLLRETLAQCIATDDPSLKEK